MIAFSDACRGLFGVELICCTLSAAVGSFSPHVAIGPPKPSRPGTRRSATRWSSPICALCTSRTFSRLRGQEVAMRRRGWQIGRELTGRLMRGCRAGPTRQAGVHHHRRPGRGHTGGSGGSPLHRTGYGWRTSPNGTCAGSRYTAFVTDAATKATVGWAGGGHDAHRGSAVAGVQSCGVASGFRSIRVGASFRPRFAPLPATPGRHSGITLPKPLSVLSPCQRQPTG